MRRTLPVGVGRGPGRSPERRAGPGAVHGTTHARVNVVFVEPFFPPTQRDFVRALAEVGANVIGIGESPTEMLDEQLKGWMTHYHQVPTVVDVGIMTDAVRWIQDKVWVDRLETTIEAHTMAAAQVRENCTIPGTSVRTAWLCRDKPSMKEALRAAGVPTAASTAADNAEQVHAFADAVGYPLILKPRSGAGAQDTTRVDNRAELDAALGAFGGQGTDSIAVEEFVEGHEGFYDTLSIDGDPRSTSSRTTTPTCSTRCAPDGSRRSSSRPTGSTRWPTTGSCARWAHRVNEALGIGTSATHMEWFFGPKGLRFSEIGCRPPGVGAWDLYSAGNDLDVYRRVGERDRARPRGRPAVAAVRHGHRRACGPTATDRSPATPGSTRCRPDRASG